MEVITIVEVAELVQTQEAAEVGITIVPVLHLEVVLIVEYEDLQVVLHGVSVQVGAVAQAQEVAEVVLQNQALLVQEVIDYVCFLK